MIGLENKLVSDMTRRKVLLVENHERCHCEVIESVIAKSQLIIGEQVDDVYVDVISSEYKHYIQVNRPDLRIGRPKDFDFCINCTAYPKDLPEIKSKDPHKYFFITHRFDTRFDNLSNVYGFTPRLKRFIWCDDFAFCKSPKIQTEVPIYCIQGTIACGRRDYSLLTDILEATYQYPFLIKMIGKGRELPKSLLRHSKLIVKRNLNFTDYHREFLDCFGLLPLISREQQPQYYQDRTSSSLHYAKAYDILCLLDSEQQAIHRLSNVMVYNCRDDIVDCFAKSLELFYTQRGES